MVEAEPDADKAIKVPSAEKLISVLSVNDLDDAWVHSEISFLENIRDIYDKDTLCRAKKEQYVEHFTSIAKRSEEICNLIRVLFRLAKAQTTTKKLCNEVVSAVSANLKAQMSTKSFANAVKEKEPLKKPPKVLKTIEKESVPIKVLPPMSEITLIPKNGYDEDLKKVSGSLKQNRINSARKSKNGNIVISCENDEEMKRVEEALSSAQFVQVKKMEKNLPKMTIIGAEEIDSREEVIEDLKSRNVFLHDLVEKGKKLEVLFMKKNNGLNNITIRVDPEIRNAILENKAKVYVGLKRCHVSDSFPFKVCYNCQETCSHMSDSCNSRVKICRYCGQNHLSKSCPMKNDATKHRCINCLNSNISRIKNNAGSHFSNASSCPLVKLLIDNMKANTIYSCESKND